MSSDRKDPGATWQETRDAHWGQGQASEQVALYDEGWASVSGEQQQLAAPLPPGTPVAVEEEESGEDGVDEADDLVEPIATPGDLAGQLLRYAALIIFPLIFGALTCSLVLPSVARGKAYLPLTWLWPIAILLVAIAIGQGFAVYRSSKHPHFWLLGTIGGLFGFLLVGCFALFGPLWAGLLFFVLGALAVLMVRRSFHQVPEGVVDIVFVSGKYRRTLEAGLHLLLPWEEIAEQVNVNETHWNCPPQKIQLSPEEDVVMRALISYQVPPKKAYLTVTQVNNWEESLRELFLTTVQKTAALFTPSDFITWPQSLHTYQAQQPVGDPRASGVDDFEGGLARREYINTYLLQEMRSAVADWGVQINWVNIRDIELAPHRVALVDSSGETAEARAEEGEQEAVRQDEPMVLPAVPAEVVSVPKQSEQTILVQQPAAATPVELPKEEILIKAYKEVQNGKITDPEAIRSIAATFEAVARNPQASQTVSFDAARAALNLHEQARKYEELYRSGALYSDDTKPDWAMAAPPPGQP